MFIKSIDLYQFRNIAYQKLDYNSRLVVFTGNNGQGKTNFVESIYFISKGKSFRTPETNHLIYKNGDQKALRIFVELEKEGTLHRIEGIVLEDKKSIYLNGKKKSSLKVFKNFPVILFSPESLSILKDGPENRRQLFDEMLILKEESNVSLFEDFKKSLRSRNALWKQFKTGQISEKTLRDILTSLNQVYSILSVQITNQRFDLIRGIQEEYSEIVKQITNQNVNTYVDYVDEKGIKISESTDYNTMLKKIESRIDLELRLGSTLVGPHKHDMRFYMDGKEGRYFCSQGQQRALILALKLTQILYHHRIYGYYPILILDDVLSELDREKRSYLIQFLSKNKAQTFLTSTDLEQHKELRNLDLIQFIVNSGTAIKG